MTRALSPSHRKIAQLAGVSNAAVSFALRNQPGVSPATRERILRIAKELDYAPDARLSHWMSRVQEAKSKELLPIAWLNTAEEEDAWRRYRFHTPYTEGAHARAKELGYKIEEIWAQEPGMTMRRLAGILFQRGIEGVIITHPARHLRLNWNHLASVTIGTSLLAPWLHRIIPDLNFNLQLALKSLRRLGYRRIGICLGLEIDVASQSSIRALARDFYFNASNAERIPPLFHAHCWRKGGDEQTKQRDTIKWIKTHKPEVIVGHDNLLIEWINSAGFRVPEDMSVVHLAVDDDVLDWAGIHSRRREMGATAVDQLVALMRNHQFGVPKEPLNIMMRGSWQPGRTLSQSP